MKITTFLILICVMQTSATTYAQRVTFAGNDVSIQQLLREITRQTGYSVFYADSKIDQDRRLAVRFNNATLERVLDISFQGQPVSYTIKDKNIVLVRKEQSVFEKLSGIFTSIHVAGIVRDGNGQPLPGATVRIKNTNRIVVTNAAGKFEFSSVEEKSVFVVTYTGYKTVEVEAKAQLSVSLQPENQELGEITISTGYQRIRKDQLTGAASALSAKDYHQREAITGNFLESLEGKVPGLVYNGQTGELSIRGVSTFDAVKQPLIVLDGFPTEMDLRTINPNDIVSISVLRDAAAASIYGVRASNGVIIVETRRGRSGKATFNLTSSYAVQARPDFSYLRYASGSEFVELQRAQFYKATPAKLLYDMGYYKMNPAQEILFQGPQAGVDNPALTQIQVDEQLKMLGSHSNLSEYERLFYQQRQVKNINFDVSGGNEASTYFLGVNYIGEMPVSRGAANKQININLANTIRVSDRFNFDFKGTYTTNKNQSGTTPGYGEFFPYEQLVDEQGNALQVTLGPGRNSTSTFISSTSNESLMAAGLYDMLYYPYRELSGTTNAYKASVARFQGRLNSKITSWMNLDLGGNYEIQNATNNQLQTPDAIGLRRLVNSMALKDASGKAVFSNLPQGNILKKNIQKLSNYTLRGQLNFSQVFSDNKHNISGMLGAEQKRTYSEGFMTSFFGYDGESLIVRPINMSVLNATTRSAFTFSPLGNTARFSSTDYFGESAADRRFMSYYGQGTYIFNSKYVATGSFRIDQSNLFGVDPKYRNKPLWSAGLNWRLSSEDFMRSLSWIDNLQLRTATGFNGNVPTSNNGSFLILTSALNTTFSNPLQYNDVLTPENQSLRWETTRNHNFGADYSFFNSFISGSIDYYIKRSTDVFGLFEGDPTMGFNQYNANTASIENSGLELLVNMALAKRAKFGWNLQLTSSFNHNKVLAVKASDFSASVQYVNAANPVVGKPIGSLYSYNYGGLNAVGQPFVYDKDGNQKIIAIGSAGPGLGDVTKGDLLYSGTTTPKYVLGFNNQFRIAAFDFSFLWMYYGGHVMRVEQPNPYNVDEVSYPLQGSSNFWRAPGDEAKTRIPGFVGASNASGYFSSQALYGYRYADQFVRKADYIRLRDVVVSYRAHAAFLDRAGLKNTQIRFQAQNPFHYTFSGNDIDPDAINRITGARRLETQPLYSLTFSTNF